MHAALLSQSQSGLDGRLPTKPHSSRPFAAAETWVGTVDGFFRKERLHSQLEEDRIGENEYSEEVREVRWAFQKPTGGMENLSTSTKNEPRGRATSVGAVVLNLLRISLRCKAAG